MKNKISFGMNRTGIQMSPLLSKRMESAYQDFPHTPVDTSISFADFKQTYIQEADSLGSIPLPGSLQGAISTGKQFVKGEHPEILIDKLGERLAFERAGVRLYDALIAKAEVAMPGESLSKLYQFRNEEAEHFAMIRDAIESIGGDPTCQTPCADVSGMTSMGLMQVLNDPRTNLAQCVEAILTAELTDNDGWSLLIQLVKNTDLSDQTSKFMIAKGNEDQHLEYMRAWLRELLLEPGVAIPH
jgi:rubrerythrin